MMPKFSILVVDDDPLLVDILRIASAHTFPEASFIQVYSDLEAISYINQLDGYGPKLVLLDIDLGGNTNEFAFIALLRAHKEAHLLPVVILTVNPLSDQVMAAYSFGASAFTIKPFSYEGWKAYLGHLRLYWFQTVTLPKIYFNKHL